MAHSSDDGAATSIERQLGWFIALAGTIVVLDPTVLQLGGLRDWSPWWNAAGFVLVLGVAALAAAGRVLPFPVLSAGWVVLPALYVVLQGTWVLAHRGPSVQDAVPWTWTLEPPMITFLVLVLRPLPAVVGSVAISCVPALTSLALLGDLPRAIAHETLHQVGNVVYVLIVLGVRRQLQQLREIRLAAGTQDLRRASATFREKQQLRTARLVHDEILSVLAAAMQTTGPPDPTLRRAADRGMAVLEGSSEDAGPPRGTVTTTEASLTLSAAVRTLDESARIETVVDGGRVPRVVAEAIRGAAAEALRNSLRHAGADASRCARIHVSELTMVVTITDDGVGAEGLPHRNCFGISRGIVDRMAEIGGSGAVGAVPGVGTSVVLRWPT